MLEDREELITFFVVDTNGVLFLYDDPVVIFLAILNYNLKKNHGK